MKVLVTYHSDTGNTEKVARAIYEAIEHAEKEIFPLKEVGQKDISAYDLIFCGFPVQASCVPDKVHPFLKGLPKGSLLALFSTHGSLRGGPLTIEAMHEALGLAKQAVILGTFCCRGKVKHSLLEALEKRPQHKKWIEEAQSAAGHPDEHDLEDAKEFARWMITRARSYLS